MRNAYVVLIIVWKWNIMKMGQWEYLRTIKLVRKWKNLSTKKTELIYVFAKCIKR